MATTLLVTTEGLLALGSDARFELIEGVLYEVSPSGIKSSVVAGRVFLAVIQFVDDHGLGYVSIADGGYVLGHNPDTVIAPDVAFFRKEHVPNGIPDRGFFPLPPDFAVEVISPTDKRGDIERKQSLYARYGVPLVWWVDPERKTVTVHRPGQQPEVIEESGTLDGGAVLPGFSLPLEKIFRD